MMNPQIHWTHMPLRPIVTKRPTIHIVPVMSKYEELPDIASAHQGSCLSPRK